MKNKIFAVLLVSSLIFSTAAFADRGGDCPWKGRGDRDGCSGEGSKGGCPITAKIMKKAHFFMANAKEIGLKDEQIEAIKAVKMETKKAHIRQMAEMQIFQIDLKEQLSAPKVDEQAVHAMIDQASAGMNAGAKASVASYIKLKSILSEDQMKKAKEIWMAEKYSR